MESVYIKPFGNLAAAEELGLKPDTHNGVTLVWSRFGSVDLAWARAKLIANWAPREDMDIA